MFFEKKTVLITGAGVGIGRAAAILFAKHGALIAANSISGVSSDETVAMVREYSKGISVKGDVSDSRDVKRIVGGALEAFGRIDILVNNAGIVIPGRIDSTAEEDWIRTMDVNLKSVFLMSREVIPHMKKAGGGSIVNVASSVAHKGVADRAAYTASKGGVLALTRAMAIDCLPDHIRVNCVSPGTTDTPSLAERISKSDDIEQAREAFIDRQPMKRLGLDSEIAMAILFAACDEAAFMNGANLSIDGGMTC